VWTSSLLLVAEIEAALRDGAASASSPPTPAPLRPATCARSALAPTRRCEGLALDSRFRATVLEDRHELDVGEAERATVAAAERLVARHPEVAAIVLECTNMPPYADAVRAATGLPVHDLTTLVRARLGAATSAEARHE
jgi:Asp/Glu/hydantoin racemase